LSFCDFEHSQEDGQEQRKLNIRQEKINTKKEENNNFVLEK